MVDLPTVGNAIVTSTAPQSSVSRGDIQQNADLMANALSKVADAGMDVATELAKKQAADELQQQKVTRNADGTVDVVNPAGGSLIFGRAGLQYEEAVKVGTVAQHANVISSELNDIHLKHQADPGGFKVASDAWKETYLAQHGGGQVGAAISREFDSLQTQHANSIADTAAKIDLQKSAGDISALQESARNDALTMARGGVGKDDPAMLGKIAQFDAASQRRRDNPLFGYSPEQAALDRSGFVSEIQAGNYLHNIDRTYNDKGDGGGYKGAAKAAEDILTNTGYDLSQKQREAYYHMATAELRANEAMRHQDISEAQASLRELSMAAAGGARIQSDDVESIAQKFEAAGDVGGAATARRLFINKPLNDAFGNQSVSTMTDQLAMLHGASAAAAAHKYFSSNPEYGPIASAGIVGNQVHESGMDPTAVGDGGTSGGLAQWHAERLTALKAYAASVGKPATDFQTQLEFTDKELHQPENAATLAKLQAAKTPEEAAVAFMDFERPKGWQPGNPTGGLGFQSRQSLARQVFEGKTASMSGGPAATLWLEANRASTLTDAATKQWRTILQDFHAEGIVPSVQRVGDVQRAATMTQNAPLLDAIAHDSARFDLVRDAPNHSLPEISAAITELKTRATGGGEDPGVAATIKGLEQVRNAITTGLDNNPIATTTTKNPGMFKTVAPLDLGNPDTMVAQLAQRAKIAGFGARKWEVSPRSALDASDIAQVQGALASPDPAVKVRIFSALSTLPEDIRGATFAKLGENGVVGATEAFAGSLLGADPKAADIGASILTGLKAQDVDERLVPIGKGAAPGNKLAYQNAKDGALPIAAFSFGARTNPTGAYAVMSAAIDARYASLSAAAGSTSGVVDTNRLKKAAEDVTGGIVYQNGAPLIAPARGMKQRQFEGIMAGVTDADVTGMQTGAGKPLNAEFLRSSAKLRSFQSGRYLVQVNQDDENPKYAAGADGRAFVLDLRGRTPPVAFEAAPEPALVLP